MSDLFATKAEQVIVTAAIGGLGVLAVVLKGLDAANAWVRHKERLTLDGIAKASK